MRLLILTPEYTAHGGGISTFYRSLAASMPDVDIRIVEGSAFNAETEHGRRRVDGVQVEVLERHRLDDWWRRFCGLEAMPLLRRHLAAAWAMWEQADRGEGADLVEVCDWGLLFAPPVIESTRPTIVQCHGSVGQIALADPIKGEELQGLVARLMERDLLASHGAIQTLSEANGRHWRAETSAAVDVIRPAWTPRAPASPTAIGDRGLVVGRMQRWKGPETLCLALAQLGVRAPRIEWLGRDMPWGAPRTPTSRHLAAAYPAVWGAKVIPSPVASPLEVASRQASALFNVVPSTWDVFNLTAVEAMISGRPVIVSTGAGASELITDGEDGLLFTAGDADDLAGRIDQMLSMPESRRVDMGRAAQTTICRRLDPGRVGKVRMAAYEAAISAFATSRRPPVEGWLGQACRPNAAASGDGLSFLNDFPIRDIAGHLVRRLAERFRRTPDPA